MLRVHFAASTLVALLVATFKDNAGNTFEFYTNAKHTFHAALLLCHSEEREKVYNLIHELYIRASTGILRILEDIGEKCDERRDRKVEDQPVNGSA